jgi:serine/threonine protein kinase
MGMVFRALDTRFDRPVAVKISSELFSKRFEREARAISALNHPNVCTLYDVGSLPSGAAYMVTELVEGETLREWLKHSPPLDRKMAMMFQVIEGLRAAHDAGIVHGDLKPANIMVRFDGYVKVLDFGLAKRISTAAGAARGTELSAPGQIVGTAAYMSPERIAGEEADARSDLFASGIILYEMMAGRHPWIGKSSIDTMHTIVHDDPPPIEAPPALERVVRRCPEKRAIHRFQTAGELAAALREAAAEVSASATRAQSSIAVLPFANMSADKENEYFGDGPAEEIINELAGVAEIKVAARTSSFFFKGKDVEFEEIGKRLHVEHILEGSVRKAGNRVRITRAIDQGKRWISSLVGPLRSRDDGHLRHPGRNHKGDRGSAARQAVSEGGNHEALHAQCARL